jgi:hypothetical protein
VFGAGALSAAAACFAAAAMFHRHRDRVVWARARRFRSSAPGPRQRYLRGRAAQLDMAVPIVACALLGLALLAAGLATLV